MPKFVCVVALPENTNDATNYLSSLQEYHTYECRDGKESEFFLIQHQINSSKALKINESSIPTYKTPGSISKDCSPVTQTKGDIQAREILGCHFVLEYHYISPCKGTIMSWLKSALPCTTKFINIEVKTMCPLQEDSAKKLQIITKNR